MHDFLRASLRWSAWSITVWAIAIGSPVTGCQDRIPQGFECPAPAGLPPVRYEPAEDAPLTVVCFLGTECPVVQLYADRLAEMSREFGDRGVKFLGIFSNYQDSLEEVETFVTHHPLPFPVGRDGDQQVADLLGATRTPEVVVLGPAGEILYRGQIDDQFTPGIRRDSVQQNFLHDALTAVLSREPIERTQTEPAGCLIGRAPASKPTSRYTFAADIAPILNRHCVECHRADQIGPMALTDFEEVAGWGEMLVEVVEEGRMPPWHADPNVGQFSNARGLSAAERSLLAEWVAGGMPRGDLAQLPTPPSFVEGWRLPREPDQVLAMSNRPFDVPAAGTIEYQYFVVDPGFTEDRWVTATEVIPGDRSVVHHSIVFIRPPDGSPFRGVGWLAGYVPGQSPPAPRPGHAIRIPAGSKLVFQQHYTPNGRPTTDTTRIGLVFADPKEITHEIYTLIALDQDFEIPPEQTESVTLRLDHFPRDAVLLSVSPHMHFRGRSFELSQQAEGERTPLLQVPRYDFNWQHSYRFANPIPLNEIDELVCRVTFDNSETNPFNPDPSEYVGWGDQTWEEMAVAFFDIARPLERTPQEATMRKSAEGRLPRSDFEAEADAFFARFDRDRDGLILRAETPNVIKHFGFETLDLNGDGAISRDEWIQVRRSRGRESALPSGDE